MPRPHLVVTGVACAVAAALAFASIGATPANAIAGGQAVEPGSYPFIAKVTVGESRSCTGALVAPQWIATSATCFPANGPARPGGLPAETTTATVGRADLTGSDGQVLAVTKVVVRSDRDLALARLAVPVAGSTPVSIASTAPQSGEVLRIGGYGRTANEWVPDRLQVADFSVQEVADTTLRVAGVTAGTNTCKGDAGGPALREQGGQLQLVGLNHTSWQAGCLGVNDTRTAATETRVDNIADWIRQQTTAAVAGVGFLDVDGVQHVFSGSADGSIYETSWGAGGALTTRTLGNAGAPVVSIDAARTPDGVSHVFAGTSTGKIYESYWGAGRALTTYELSSVDAEITTIDFDNTPDGVYHVFTGTSTGAIHETYWGAGHAVRTYPLAQVGGSVVDVRYARTSNGVYHVFSATPAGAIHETYWGAGLPLTTYLLSSVSGPLTSIDFEVTPDGVYHVFSGTGAGVIHETYWGAGRPLTTYPLSTVSGPLTDLDFAVTPDGVYHVFSGTAAGGVQETYWGAGHRVTTYELGSVSGPVTSLRFAHRAGGAYHVFGGTAAGTVHETGWGAGRPLATRLLADVGNGATQAMPAVGSA